VALLRAMTDLTESVMVSTITFIEGVGGIVGVYLVHEQQLRRDSGELPCLPFSLPIASAMNREIA
jgi:hypothetical protein